jgi:hypothetical protein
LSFASDFLHKKASELYHTLHAAQIWHFSKLEDKDLGTDKFPLTTTSLQLKRNYEPSNGTSAFHPNEATLKSDTLILLIDYTFVQNVHLSLISQSP